MINARVYTIGDSTIDNLYWMLNGTGTNLEEAKANSVEGRLQTEFGDRYEVVSHAYDGFTTRTVLGENDHAIGDVFYQGGGKWYAYMNTKTKTGEVSQNVKPLDELKKSINGFDGPQFVVISVGGNDFRQNILNPIRLIQDIPQVQNRYLQIIEKVKGLSGRKVQPILMSQYRPDANNDDYFIYTVLGGIGALAFIVNLACLAAIVVPMVLLATGPLVLTVSTIVFPIVGLLGLYLSHKAVPLSVTKDICLLRKPSMSLIGALLARFYRPILAQAQKDGIPILDLSNTFNPYQGLYKCGIEPNEKGSGLIVEGIVHIVQNHSFGKSQIYAKSGDSYTGSENIQSWKVAYPTKV